jgi:hypothetical protein
VNHLLEAAVAELHAARSAMQTACNNLHRAVQTGKPIVDDHLRVIDAEIRGAAEEAAVAAALLDSLLRALPSDHRRSALARAAPGLTSLRRCG